MLVNLITIGVISAQRDDNYNFKGFKKKYYFGIALGGNSADFKVSRSKRFVQTDTFASVESVRGPGFNIGVISNLNIGKYFDARFVPTLSFQTRNINYRPNPTSVVFEQRKVESVFVEFPFQFRYKSEPYKDMRMFVIAGIKYGFDVAGESKRRAFESLLKVAPTDFSVEVGAGMQFFLPFFIFSPEFKFSHGLNNILLYNQNVPQSTVLDKVVSRTFSITLNFEG